MRRPALWNHCRLGAYQSPNLTRVFHFFHTFRRKQSFAISSRDILLQLFLLLLLGITVACKNKPDAGADPSVTTLGSTEVTAELLAVPGEFPPNDLYNYAYVLKYRVLAVHRGQVEQGEEILVAHYNPLKTRAGAADETSGKLGGNLQKFKAADVHRMALEEPLDQHWMGGVIDKYFDQKGARYWAVWTNLAKP